MIMFDKGSDGIMQLYSDQVTNNYTIEPVDLHTGRSMGYTVRAVVDDESNIAIILYKDGSFTILQGAEYRIISRGDEP